MNNTKDNKPKQHLATKLVTHSATHEKPKFKKCNYMHNKKKLC